MIFEKLFGFCWVEGNFRCLGCFRCFGVFRGLGVGMFALTLTILNGDFNREY